MSSGDRARYGPISTSPGFYGLLYLEVDVSKGFACKRFTQEKSCEEKIREEETERTIRSQCMLTPVEQKRPGTS